MKSISIPLNDKTSLISFVHPTMYTHVPSSVIIPTTQPFFWIINYMFLVIQPYIRMP